jgi:hypothetical protein
MRRNLREGTIPGVKVGARWYVSSRVLDAILEGRSYPLPPRLDDDVPDGDDVP